MKISRPFLLTVPMLSMLLFISIYPLIYSCTLSFFYYYLTKPAEMRFVGLDNYVSALFSYPFQRAAINTIIFTLTVVLAEFLLGFGMALLLFEDFKGRGIVTSVLLFPLMLSPVLAGIMWRLMFHPQQGIIDYLLNLMGIPSILWLGNVFYAMVAVIVTDIWQWTPFMFAALLAGMSSLPREPYEAAQIDGASFWQTTREITLPLLRPLILVFVLLRSIDAFRTFDLIYAITGGGPGFATETLSMLIYRIGFMTFDMGEASALSYIVIFLFLTPYALLISRLLGERKTH